MSPWQVRWSVVAALVCVSAVATHRARGEEASSATPGATIATDRTAQPGGRRPDRGAPPGGLHADAPRGAVAPGPLRLARPLDPETRARALEEAESAYRARRFEQARRAYATLAELEPLNAHAWLRLGNLHQHAGRDDEALDAYRNASLTIPSTRAEAEARGKALLNIALLNVAAASRAIDELDGMRLGGLADARTDAARQVGAQRHRAARAAARDFGASRPGDDPAAEAPATDATGPWTVDRWTGRPRRAVRRPDAPGRGAVVEPLGDAPAPTPRPIEVLRGGVAAPRP